MYLFTSDDTAALTSWFWGVRRRERAHQGGKRKQNCFYIISLFAERFANGARGCDNPPMARWAAEWPAASESASMNRESRTNRRRSAGRRWPRPRLRAAASRNHCASQTDRPSLRLNSSGRRYRYRGFVSTKQTRINEKDFSDQAEPKTKKKNRKRKIINKRNIYTNSPTKHLALH